ncbi:MAG: LysR family transcriptional regulator [Cellulosilyticum sp.]|nr:LysR family transcriptional regulator [Cellulosilyticum sp.]
MDLKDLKSFVAVYETRSIHQAAKRLYITPQGLGSIIKTLEKRLDTVLFERDKQGVKPTESAELLYKRAFGLIEQFEKMINEMEQLKKQASRLRVGCACGTFNVLPFEYIQEFIKENLDIQVELCEYTNEEVKRLLLASQLEYGFIIGHWQEERIQLDKLASRAMYLIVYEGHPFWECEEVTIKMLEDQPLILLNEDFTIFHELKKLCQMRGFHPKIIAKTTDINFQHKLCRKKMGIVILPDFIIEDFDMTHLRAIPFQERFAWEVYGVCDKEHMHYRVIQIFKNFLDTYRHTTYKENVDM